MHAKQLHCATACTYWININCCLCIHFDNWLRIPLTQITLILIGSGWVGGPPRNTHIDTHKYTHMDTRIHMLYTRLTSTHDRCTRTAKIRTTTVDTQHNAVFIFFIFCLFVCFDLIVCYWYWAAARNNGGKRDARAKKGGIIIIFDYRPYQLRYVKRLVCDGRAALLGRHPLCTCHRAGLITCPRYTNISTREMLLPSEERPSIVIRAWEFELS